MSPTRRGDPHTALLLPVFLAAACGGGCHAAPASAAAGLACPTPTSQPFAPWGDSASYRLAPNGGFESGATGWTLAGGAQVAAGNESFAVNGAGARSLALPGGSSAHDAPMCVSLLSGQMRFFVRNTGSAAARLRVRVIYKGGAGALLGGLGSTLGLTDVRTIAAGSAWQPSPVVSMLGGAVPLFTTSVQFRFEPVGASGAWQIDDVYLDPLKHR